MWNLSRITKERAFICLFVFLLALLSQYCSQTAVPSHTCSTAVTNLRATWTITFLSFLLNTLCFRSHVLRHHNRNPNPAVHVTEVLWGAMRAEEPHELFPKPPNCTKTPSLHSTSDAVHKLEQHDAFPSTRPWMSSFCSSKQSGF